jgi:DNA-nicking Smr family endonuclease
MQLALAGRASPPDHAWMAKLRSNSITPEDQALFRESIGEVAPVVSDRVAPEPVLPTPRPRQLMRDDEAVVAELAMVSIAELEASQDEPLAWARGGHNPKLLRRLGRGEYSPRAEIDLHGLTVAAAQTALSRFLTECRERGHLCVRVIHGKGLNSPQGPVLKRLTDRVLRHRGDVLAFRAARPNDGGGGAAIVLLKRV